MVSLHTIFDAFSSMTFTSKNGSDVLFILLVIIPIVLLHAIEHFVIHFWLIWVQFMPCKQNPLSNHLKFDNLELYLQLCWWSDFHPRTHTLHSTNHCQQRTQMNHYIIQVKWTAFLIEPCCDSWMHLFLEMSQAKKLNRYF